MVQPPEPAFDAISIGMEVRLDGRLCVVVGFDPINVVPRSVYLETVETREPRTAALHEVVAAGSHRPEAAR